jgi:hypothetical protein
MPSKSKKQHDTFQAVVHSEEFEKEVGIPKEVAEEFLQADKDAGLFQPDSSKEKGH